MFERGTMDVEKLTSGADAAAVYPWDEIQVGSYFAVPEAGYANARSSMSRRNQRHPETRFVSRTVAGQHRFVRIR